MTTRPDLDSTLTSIFDDLSRKMAGGLRTDPRDLLPEADNPLEGVIPDEFLPEVSQFDWFDPTVWAKASTEDMSMVDLSNLQPATGAGKGGKGRDWFRADQAPNNYTNRNNPLYQARREFSVALAPKLEEMFGVTSEGSAGYIRPPSKGDAAPGGRAVNSDHQSGGAVDFFGEVAELDALRDFLVTQPYVSFVRWRSESHGGASGTESGAHVHVSFDLGWIAQNYFEGRAVPQISKTPTVSSTQLREAPRSPEDAPKPSAMLDAGKVL
jgi:hypothetical protein